MVSKPYWSYKHPLPSLSNFHHSKWQKSVPLLHCKLSQFVLFRGFKIDDGWADYFHKLIYFCCLIISCYTEIFWRNFGIGLGLKRNSNFLCWMNFNSDLVRRQLLSFGCWEDRHLWKFRIRVAITMIKPLNFIH